MSTNTVTNTCAKCQKTLLNLPRFIHKNQTICPKCFLLTTTTTPKELSYGNKTPTPITT